MRALKGPSEAMLAAGGLEVDLTSVAKLKSILRWIALLRNLILRREDIAQIGVKMFREERCAPVAASINCTVTRTRAPARRTLPSST